MMMPKISRLLTGAAALVLLATFALPLWQIRLLAPQYPEGLGLRIHLNTVTGVNPTDLANINELNHYIGMKVIEPSAIPVLRIMPLVVAALVVTGLIAAIIGRRALLVAWLASFAALAVGGLAEFWRWEYDYGHYLDLEHAIIRVPGMSYQPPVIGAKQLLNFTAVSWPGPGAWIAALAFALGATAVVVAFRRHVARSGGRGQYALVARDPTERLMFGSTARSRRAEGDVARWIAAAIGRAVALSAAAFPVAGQEVVSVSAAGPIRTLGAALRTVRPGGRIVVQPGVYREPTIVVDRPVTIVGNGFPTLDGVGAREIMTIAADDVTVTGLRFAHVGPSFVDDRAALAVRHAHGCRIANNRVDDAFFGIYLADVAACRIEHNVVHGTPRTEARTGNGIHAWSSRQLVIAGNRISGHRDGIYFEFVRTSEVRDNVSERNLRYGLHFMYSDSCRYSNNTFRHNGAGVAVMYTHRVEIVGNRFEQNWGAAAYGLLLKEILDSRLDRNVFADNTAALIADGANRLVADRNTFAHNGWAVNLEASTQDARFTDNDFVGNTFDVTTNSRESTSTFDGNYWDRYDGYDLDRDGVGDVPYRPVRLFSLIAAQNEPALVLLHSSFVGLLDTAERVVPNLTPAMLADAHPRMRRHP